MRAAWMAGCIVMHMLLEWVYQVDMAGTMVVVGLVGQLFHIYIQHVADVCDGPWDTELVQWHKNSLMHVLGCMSDAHTGLGYMLDMCAGVHVRCVRWGACQTRILGCILGCILDAHTGVHVGCMYWGACQMAKVRGAGCVCVCRVPMHVQGMRVHGWRGEFWWSIRGGQRGGHQQFFTR